MMMELTKNARLHFRYQEKISAHDSPTLYRIFIGPEGGGEHIRAPIQVFEVVVCLPIGNGKRSNMLDDQLNSRKRC